MRSKVSLPELSGQDSRLHDALDIVSKDSYDGGQNLLLSVVVTLNSDPSFPHRDVFGAAYSPSKTALHAITLAFAIELVPTNIKVNAACPGFTSTALNNFAGTRTVEQGARKPCAWRLSARTVRRARSRTRTARSRGDVASSA